jgi:hypothetical protein
MELSSFRTGHWGAMRIQLDLEWSENPSLTVDMQDGVVLARVHPGLSQAQVAQACGELGPVGDKVHRAWQERVGVT